VNKREAAHDVKNRFGDKIFLVFGEELKIRETGKE
jgi:hypothetical protein